MLLFYPVPRALMLGGTASPSGCSARAGHCFLHTDIWPMFCVLCLDEGLASLLDVAAILDHWSGTNSHYWDWIPPYITQYMGLFSQPLAEPHHSFWHWGDAFTRKSRTRHVNVFRPAVYSTFCELLCPGIPRYTTCFTQTADPTTYQWVRLPLCTSATEQACVPKVLKLAQNYAI